MNKNGFTLVELSIVLVIIGLLIGGILAAQSMITTSKIQGTVRQIGQFDAAVENFQSKYNFLPGDNNLFGSTGVTVNGIISDDSGLTYDSFTFSGESGRFWYDLKLSGLETTRPDNLTDCSVVCETAGNTPSNNLAKSDWVAISYNNSTVGRNYYLLGNFEFISAGSGLFDAGSLPAIRSIDALAVDKKIDDGINYYSASVGNKVVTATSFDSCADGSNNYLTDPNTICYLMVRIGATTGNLK